MKLISSWHPTYAFFRDPYEWATFEIDLDRFSRMIRRELEPGPKKLIIAPKEADVQRLHRRALREPITVDIETVPARPGKEWRYTGKKPTMAKMQMVGVGFPDEGLSVLWQMGTSKVERALAALLADPKCVKVFHNGDYFDLTVMARHGLVVNNAEDTREARRATSSTSSLKLAYLGSIFTDYHAWKEDDTDDEKGLVFTDDLTKKLEYNVHDCVVTARVWRGITSDAEWKTPRVQKLYAHQRKLADVGASMHRVGVLIDKKRRMQLADELAALYDEREKAFLKKVGIRGFKCNPNYVRALIYEKHATGKYAAFGRFNLPDPIDPAFYRDKEMTRIKVDSSALTLLLIDPTIPQDLKDIIEAYWDAEEVWKLRGTFVVSNRIDQAIGRDGRLRAGWNSCGTDTGRFACLVGETPVTTLRGVVPLETVRPGDFVWTHHERWKRVSSFLRQGVKPVVRVKFSNGDVLTCTSDHRLLSSEGRWVTPDEARTQGYPLFAGEGQPVRFVEEIDACGSREVYDLSVADDHSFQVGSVFAHNCSEPNLMNIPASEDVPWANVRSMYVAAPGFTIIGADYSQLELRMMAAIAKDDALTAALNSGDVYTAEAIEYFSLPPDTTKATIKQDARKSAKVIRLARQYGAGKKKGFQIAVMINRKMTFLSFIPLMNAFDRRNWRTVAYWDEEMNRVQRCGYSESRLMGRRRTYPREPERSEVANYPIQSTAADVKNLALIEVHEALRTRRMKSRIIFDLHDAIYVEAHKKEVRAVEEIMHTAMEKEYLIDGGRYTFTAKFKTSECWGDLA